MNEPDPEHLAVLARGVTAWNEFRDHLPGRPQLSNARLANARLHGINFSGAILEEADLRRADLTEADLYKAQLRNANLEGASFRKAYLHDASISGAKVRGADFTGAHCSGIHWTDVSGAIGLEALSGRDSPPSHPPGAPGPRGTLASRTIASSLGVLYFAERLPVDPNALHLFISYTRTESEAARALTDALEAMGHHCWNYLSEPLHATEDDDVIGELIARVRRSDAVLTVTSNRAMWRAWVGHEATLAEHHFRRLVYVATEPMEDMGFTPEEEERNRRPFVMFRSADPAESARRALAVLRDDSRWGIAQQLGRNEEPR
jgi:hypothetical protein